MMTETVLIKWPQSQILMEQEWFDECILYNDDNDLDHFDDIGPQAYFVPKKRWLTLNKKKS
jgi:hypothetical protein